MRRVALTVASVCVVAVSVPAFAQEVDCGVGCGVGKQSCFSDLKLNWRACRSKCRNVPSNQERDACLRDCSHTLKGVWGTCAADGITCERECTAAPNACAVSCAEFATECKTGARQTFATCRTACGNATLGALKECLSERQTPNVGECLRGTAEARASCQGQCGMAHGLRLGNCGKGFGNCVRECRGNAKEPEPEEGGENEQPTLCASDCKDEAEQCRAGTVNQRENCQRVCQDTARRVFDECKAEARANECVEAARTARDECADACVDNSAECGRTLGACLKECHDLSPAAP